MTPWSLTLFVVGAAFGALVVVGLFLWASHDLDCPCSRCRGTEDRP